MKICNKCQKRTSKPETIMHAYYCPTCYKKIKGKQPMIKQPSIDAMKTLNEFFGL